jgi:GNAT superfamily N-acetyltransferase
LADGFVIRQFELGDAERAAELVRAVSPVSLTPASLLRHRHTAEPDRARRRSWLALEGDEPVGFATAVFQWYGGERGKGRVWVYVRRDRRRRGIGTALWDTATLHLQDAMKLTVEIDDDPDGLRFVEERGFTQYGAEVMSILDPRRCTAEPRSHEGFRVVSLGAVRDREHDLYEFYGAAGGLDPGDPENRVSFEEWRRFILENPVLNDETSVVVLDEDDRVVSLSWLLVDRPRAENEWTATLPELRGRGLARVAKIASIRAAAEHGITEILTGNDPDNLPMRELNRRLGYRELFTRLDMEKAFEPAPEAPAK